MPKFSVALIVKDESKTIPKLAESIKSFLSAGGEALILDTGSTDGTPELARSLGFTVHEVGDEFTHVITKDQADEINRLSILDGESPVVEEGRRVFDFAEAMNRAASLAKNDWILMPDADIEISMDMEKLEAVMTPENSHVRHLLKMGNMEYQHNRCYDKSKMHWEGMSHEGLYGTGARAEVPPSVLTMNHEQLHDKDRASRIGSLALDWFLHQSDYRRTFYYGRELYWRNRPKSAIAMLNRAISMNNHYPAEKAQALCFIGDAYLVLKEESKAIKAYQDAFEACSQRRIALLKLAQHHTGKDWFKTAAYAKASSAIPYSGLYIEDMDEYRFWDYYYLYPALWQTGDRKKSKECYMKAREIYPTNQKILYDERWYLDPTVSVVIPHLPMPEREAKLNRLLDSLAKSDYPNIEVIVENDSWEDRQGALKTFKKGVERSKGELVMFLGNDCEVAPNTITEAVDAMRQFPDMTGLVALNDNQSMGKKAEHWLASKKLLPFLDGEFFNTAYSHNFADIELTERCRMMGRYAFAVKAMIKHDHPMWKGTPSDKCYEVAYDKEQWARDEATYNRRKVQWSLPYTGERVVPDKMFVEPQTLAEHLARYNFANDYLHSHNTGPVSILDAPCGTGYGTQILGVCTDGCDISEEALAYARERHPIELGKYFTANLDKPDFTESYDTVTSFEGLEHLNDPKPFIEWVRTHAKEFIFSIPVNNVSKWHKVAYSVAEIKALFSAFKSVEWYEQTGTEIKPLGEGNPVFVIGIAKTA